MEDAGTDRSSRWATFVRSQRLSRGITQEALGEELGFNRITVIRWETGQVDPRTEVILAVARYFRLPAAEVWRHIADTDRSAPPQPVPRPMSDLLDLYAEIDDPTLRRDVLDRVEWVVEWARLRQLSAEVQVVNPRDPAPGDSRPSRAAPA